MGSMVFAPVVASTVGDAWADTMAGTNATASGDTVTGILSRGVQNGDYEVQDINGLSVLMPRQTTVMDVLANAVKSCRYEPQTINGVSVLMPR